MRPTFSEFSYGYAITDALVNWQGTQLTAAPVFPSLIEEGQAGGGYDVRLDRPGMPLFLQFKLSDCITQRSRSVKEVRYGLFQPPFYRMHVRSAQHSNQHSLLLGWEAQGYEVYYVAPAFHRVHEFNDAYLQRQVANKSIWIAPSWIGHLPDDQAHHVAFQLPGNRHFLSEPLIIEPSIDFDTFTRHIAARVSERGSNTVMANYIPAIAEEMLLFLNEMRFHVPVTNLQMEIIRHQTPLQQIATISRTVFDCEVFIVQEKTDQ